MSKPLVIVQSSPFKQTAFDLAAAAQIRGFAVRDISFDRDDPQPPEIGDHSPVFVFGSVALLEQWCVQYPELQRWLWYDQAALSPVAWKQNLGSDFLNESGVMCTARSFLKRSKDEVGSWHIRPLLNNKRPPGKLYDRASFVALDLPGETELWVSPPSTVTDEVRVWFVGGRAVAASQYRKNGQLVRLVETRATAAATVAASRFASRWLPHPNCVMDVIATSEDAWKVVEFNPIHGAGWYAADPGAVLDAFVAQYA